MDQPKENPTAGASEQKVSMAAQVRLRIPETIKLIAVAYAFGAVALLFLVGPSFFKDPPGGHLLFWTVGPFLALIATIILEFIGGLIFSEQLGRRISSGGGRILFGVVVFGSIAIAGFIADQALNR